MNDVPAVGSAVRVVDSRTYAGTSGTVVRYTKEMAEVLLEDGKTFKVKKKNIEAIIEQDSVKNCDEAGSMRLASGKDSIASQFDDGSSVSTHIEGNSSDRGESWETASVTSSQSLGALSLAASTVGTVARATFRGLAWGGRAVAHLALAAREGKEPTCFLKWFFGEDLQEVRPKDLDQASVEEDCEGRKYELCASRVDSEGMSFWGGANEVVRLFYVCKQPQADSVQARLESVAAFGDLREPCKVASRLELLTSSAQPNREFEREAADFELINEPQPSGESGGCGFIGESIFTELFGPGVKARRMTSIQVRIVSPALGIFKGVLTKKQGISKIQLPPSMRKVGPSDRNSAQWVYMLVTRDFPSTSNLQIAKWINGGAPCRSFRQPKFSKMLQRLMKTLGVPNDVLSIYAKQELRKEAWVVGAADPTFPANVLPAGHIYVSGLPAEHVPIVDGQRKVLVTRSPCTLPEDGHLLPLVTSKPDGMSEDDWRALTERHFGEVLFSNEGNPIPQSISEGDLDGDLYFVCWDDSIVRHVKPAACTEAAGNCGKEASQKQEQLAGRWLAEARQYMLSGGAAKTKSMIGKLYCAGEKVADKSPLGLDDPDARALFRAYSQAIDAGKHGNSIDLPEHLRKKVGMPAGVGL
mmetsp:Transcript_85388/g.150959  ORF Transcript_85388/g.150959 Transcript_85388/m.150959 type:complete len:641 (+) Transcript_85388:52-1974(+)